MDLPSGIDTISFDCYGTLIDWETGIAASLAAWAARNDLDWSAEELVAAHGRFETLVQQEFPSMAYPEVLGETLARIGESVGADVTTEDRRAYGSSVGEWPAFEDSAAALQQLGSRFRLAVLSNVDRRSFARSSERLGVDFDLAVTAEDVGSYKPSLANFEALFDALAEIGSGRQQLLHAAESIYHDIEPADRIGLPAVWINRRAGRTGWGATAVPNREVVPRWRFDSLQAFADAIAP